MILDHVTITRLRKVNIVHSPKAMPYEMIRRKCWGLSICIQGQICFQINGQRLISDINHAMLIPQGASYTVYPEKESFTYVINFECDAQTPDSIQILNLRNSQQILKICEKLKMQFQSGHNHFRAFETFYRLLGDLLDQQHPRHNLLSKAMEYMEKNLSDPKLSNAALARQAGVSEVYFRKLFRAHYNTTPKQYILNLRIQKAKQLLLESPFSVSAIAEECGFSGVYHFGRVFKEKTGSSPSRFAKDHWNAQI